MNPQITICQVSKEDYEREAIGFRAHPYIEPVWIEAFKNDSRVPSYFLFLDNTTTIGLVAGLTVTSGPRMLLPFSRYLYLYNLPVIYSDNLHHCIELFKQHLRLNGFNRLVVASYNAFLRYRLVDNGFSIRERYEHFIDLSPPLTELWRRMSNGRKWRVNKARKRGLVYNTHCGPDKLDELTECLENTKLRKACKGFGDYNYYSMPFMNTNNIAQLLHTHTFYICTVSHRNKLLSSSLVGRNMHYSSYILAGSTKEGYEVDANSYMLWEIIKESKEMGCETLCLGGIPRDQTAPHLVEFKRSFGAERRVCETGYCDLHDSPRRLLHKYYHILLNYTSLITTNIRKQCKPFSD